MAQHTFTPINPDVDTGTTLSVSLNNKDQALLTTHSGNTRPTALLAGGLWVQSGVQPGQMILNIYDGTNDIALATIDVTTDKVIYSGGGASTTTGWRATSTAGRMEYVVGSAVKAVIDNGKLSLNTTSAPAATLDVSGTDAMVIPSGTSAQRPATAERGMLRENTSNNRIEYYDGTGWRNLLRTGDGGSGGALTGILLAISSLTGASNKIIRTTGASTADLLNFRDEDGMNSDDASGVPSQQSVKAYADAGDASALTSARAYADGLITAPLNAIKGVTPASNRVPYYTSATAAGLLTYATDSALAGTGATVNNTESIKAYIDANSGGGASVTVSATAPSSPSAGDLWVNSNDLTLNLYYQDANSSQWVGISGSGGGGGAPTTETKTASGRSVEFTSLPSDLESFKMVLEGISVTSDISNTYVGFQLGTSSGFQTSGYSGNLVQSTQPGHNFVSTGSPTSSLISLSTGSVSGGETFTGSYEFTKEIGNKWSIRSISNLRIDYIMTTSLSATLDRVRLTITTNNTFDAGMVRISYQ